MRSQSRRVYLDRGLEAALLKTMLQLEVSAASHRGRVRTSNQDAYGYSVDARCFVLCDGMGGAAGGEVASQVAVEIFLERLAPDGTAAPLARRMEQAISAANRILFTRAQREPALHGMGTTLVAVVLDEDSRASVAHVGDSRCYLLRDQTLVRCTRDHSLVEEQVRLGKLTSAQAARSPMRHVITRAVGVRRSVLVEVQQVQAAPGDLFLLCSDGVTRELPEQRIRTLLVQHAEAATRQARNPDQSLAELLVQEAVAAGGADNATCLTIRLT